MSDVTAQVIEELTLDASGYEAGAARVIAADNAMIASYQRRTAAYQQMMAATSGGMGDPNATGSFSGATLRMSAAPSAASPVDPDGGNVFNNRFYNRVNINYRFGAPPRPPRVPGPPDAGDYPDQNNYNPSIGGLGLGGAYLILSALRSVEHLLEELGKKFIAFSGDALKAFSEFDTLRLSLEGIYGSTQKASQMLKYLQEESMHSAFLFRDLANSARGLSVAGLDVNRFLPIVQGFALAAGQINAGGLDEFVGILRRIMGGNTGLALGPRGIGRYGVSQQELEAQGATFDSNRHFTGSINQAFDAIEGVYNSRIAKIAEKVTASAEVVMSNFSQSIQQATVQAGAGIAQNLLGPIKQVTNALNSLRDAGGFKLLFDDIYRIINVQGMLGQNNEAKYDFNSPEEQRTYARKRFGIYADPTKISDDGHGLPPGLFEPPQSIKNYRQHMNDVNNERPHTTGDLLTDTLIHIGGYMVKLVEFAKEEVDALNWMAKKVGMGNIVGGGPEQARLNFEKDAFQGYYNRYLERLISGPAKAPAPAGTGIEGVDEDAVQESRNHLRHIRASSERIANHFDSKATAFGGGDVGRQGVFAYEMTPYYASVGHGVKEKFAQFGGAIEQEMHRIAHEAFGNGLRQGLFRNQ